MTDSLSPNTQAILLLTAPLIVGRNTPEADLLTPALYRRLAAALREAGLEPADLLGEQAAARCERLAGACAPHLSAERLHALIGRGFQLSQAFDGWRARAIWVVSRADADYPPRLKTRLRDAAPPVLYGCGDAGLIDAGGLAVVGSRHVDEALIAYTEAVGRLVAGAGRPLVSGGARGIDQAAMRGALNEEGQAVGVLADGLGRAVLTREHRDLLLAGRLALVSPYDPAAGFNVGNAMQRNKIIYALADAALVVSAECQKGGTWAGATEHLQKHRAVPVYVRASGAPGEGLAALQALGAHPWPEPATSAALSQLLDAQGTLTARAEAHDESSTRLDELPLAAAATAIGPGGATLAAVHVQSAAVPSEPVSNESLAIEPRAAALTPADELFAAVRSIIVRIPAAQTEAEIADALRVSKGQVKEWLARLTAEGVIEKTGRPGRYRRVTGRPVQGRLFD